MDRGEPVFENGTGGALSVLVAGCAQHLLSEPQLGPLLQRAGLKPIDRSGAGTSRTFDIAFGRTRFTLVVPTFDANGAEQWLADHPRTVQTTRPTAQAIVGASVLVSCDDVPQPADATLRALGKVVLLLNAFLFPTHVCWLPAGLWSDASRFAQAVERSDEDGPLPLMHLVAFDPIENGAVTVGLAAMTGQELSCRNDGGLGLTATVRRLARLALDMIEQGSIDRERIIDGLVKGERISLNPVDGAVHVTISSEHS